MKSIGDKVGLKRVALVAIIAMTVAVLPSGCGRRSTVGNEVQPNAEVTYLVHDNGGRVDWLEKNLTLACDLLDHDGYCKVWTMDQNGGNRKCLSTVNSSLPHDHHGNPAWHPSGDYLVMQCGDPALRDPQVGATTYLTVTNPGAGYHNNLWLITADASRAWQLTAVGKNGGVLHPHFSPDGSRLIWAEMTSPGPRPFGTWEMKLAEFSMRGGEPALGNVTVLRPGGLEFYETHGFSPDGSTLVFTGMKAGGTPWDLDIYTCDLAGGSLKILTDPTERQWDEHAHFTPDGRSITWMSSAGINQQYGDAEQLMTDYWMMDADGSGKRRVTFFNQSGSPEYVAGGVAAADLSIADNGGHFFGYLKDSGSRATGSIVRITIIP